MAMRSQAGVSRAVSASSDTTPGRTSSSPAARTRAAVIRMVPATPIAAASVGVATPASTEPSTARISRIGGTISRSTSESFDSGAGSERADASCFHSRPTT